jgi:hypothetical protein
MLPRQKRVSDERHSKESRCCVADVLCTRLVFVLISNKGPGIVHRIEPAETDAHPYSNANTFTESESLSYRDTGARAGACANCYSNSGGMGIALAVLKRT